MSFENVVNEDQRLIILRALAQDADYSMNEYILTRILKSFSHGVSQDKLRTELAWLEEQGLLTIDKSTGVYVCKLTNRGLSVAQGDTIAPGVRRPMPGE